MPVIVKNGKTYGDRSVTLTQAEYNALSETEKNNGTCYYIYDANAMIEADNIGLDGGTVEDLAGSVATFESSPSTAVHAAGEYILYQAQLYKVTSAIAVGEDLTVGSNIEATNLGNELSAGSIKTESFTATTSSGGNISHDFASDVFVLSACCNKSDTFIVPFVSINNGTPNFTRWWFNARNAGTTDSAVTGTSMTLTVAYVVMN